LLVSMRGIGWSRGLLLLFSLLFRPVAFVSRFLFSIWMACVAFDWTFLYGPFVCRLARLVGHGPVCVC